MRTNERTLKGFRNVLVMVGVVVAIPCAALAQPAFTDRDVQQVNESMKSMNDALTASMKKNPRDPWDAFSQLVSDGFLPGPPPVPTGIGDASGNFGSGEFGAWGVRNARVGGCGPKNIGAKRDFYIQLCNVSDDFCKAYNSAQGLGPIIPLNCFTKPDDACKASSSSDGEEPVNVDSKTFCFKTSDLTNRVFFNTGFDPKVPCTE